MALVIGLAIQQKKEIGTSIYNAVQSFEDKKAAVKTRINEITQDKDKNSSTGSYTIIFESGMKYHGKGGQKRAMQSVMRISFTYDEYACKYWLDAIPES